MPEKKKKDKKEVKVRNRDLVRDLKPRKDAKGGLGGGGKPHTSLMTSWTH